MGHTEGRVIEVRFNPGRQVEFLVTCPGGAVPGSGQYIQACSPQDMAAVLGTPLYLAEKVPDGFWASTPHPAPWSPGGLLHLHGPLGNGFSMPSNITNLALATMGDSMSRLMPLVSQAVAARMSVALFTDLRMAALPSAVEVHPLAALKESLAWPDYLALDMPLERLPELRNVLGLPDGLPLPCPAQVLVTTTMPCAGMAQCGACAVPVRRGWLLACEDGPVFDLGRLKW